MERIIVEIPHQRRATAFLVNDDIHIIEIAGRAEDFSYQPVTFEDALNLWGDESQIPLDLLSLVKEHGCCIEISNKIKTEWFSPKEAPGILDAALETLFHDLNRGLLLSIDEANEFVSNDQQNIYSGHQMYEAMTAVRKLLKDI